MIAVIISLATGVFTWTFLEYVIHRFLGHKKKTDNPITQEHRQHHSQFDYFAPAWKKLIMAVIILGTLTLLVGLPVGWLYGFSYSLGIAGMYLVYEALHKRAHTHAPLNAYGRWLRMHHFYHHFRSPKHNHGVTTALWDRVFGTHKKVDVVTVPGRGIPLPWLFSEQGDILPQYQNDYQIAGRRKKQS